MMVTYSDIRLNNSSLSIAGGGTNGNGNGNGKNNGPVIVFVGGTSGIGRSTFEAVLRHIASPTIYLVGRSEAGLEQQIQQGQALNPKAKIVPVLTGDLTLVKSAQTTAQKIASLAGSRVDLLFLSQGYFSFATRPNWTVEGLDKITAIRYHSRMRFVITLLPLLRASPSPRVISILASGKEGTLDLDDLSFKRSYGPVFAAGASATLNTLAFEALAAQPDNVKIVFIHLYPGGVATGMKALEGPAMLRFLYNHTSRSFLKVFGRSLEEVGERVLFAATNGRFRRLADGVSGEGTMVQRGSNGNIGSGVYLVQDDSSVVIGNEHVEKLRDQGGPKKVLEHTLAEFERIESSKAAS
ncbi:hypothetical protein PV10_01363 [Exophiala mesophila]|uniref:Uncharacterized protein n=1 Tax=Exophiala mesophila TaxID=212818 RepID=A0A0D1ZUL9_EXOME|nr:uncharacterized protein PV10_01363 [Exophiala mesophila]KIV97644.1 hypothetical protein PV10_01363 [Exophiala mesophila]